MSAQRGRYFVALLAAEHSLPLPTAPYHRIGLFSVKFSLFFGKKSERLRKAALNLSNFPLPKLTARCLRGSRG